MLKISKNISWWSGSLTKLTSDHTYNLNAPSSLKKNKIFVQIFFFYCFKLFKNSNKFGDMSSSRYRKVYKQDSVKILCVPF